MQVTFEMKRIEAMQVLSTASVTPIVSQNRSECNSDIENRLARWNPQTLQTDVAGFLGLSPSQAMEVLELYKQFWVLLARYPQMPLVPPAIIDRIWHLHILDTRRYREDCLFLVGQFVDHQPYRGEIPDSGKLEDAAMLTLALFDHYFGFKVRSQLQAWQNILSSQPLVKPSHPESTQSLVFDPMERGECYRLW
jgi:hypothetical protein